LGICSTWHLSDPFVEGNLRQCPFIAFFEEFIDQGRLQQIAMGGSSVRRPISFLFLFLSPWIGVFGCGGGNSDSGRTTQSNGEIIVTDWVFDLL
jgi:hypothetical protein